MYTIKCFSPFYSEPKEPETPKISSKRTTEKHESILCEARVHLPKDSTTSPKDGCVSLRTCTLLPEEGTSSCLLGLLSLPEDMTVFAKNEKDAKDQRVILLM